MVSKGVQKSFIQKSERVTEWMFWLVIAMFLNAAYQGVSFFFPEEVSSVLGQTITSFLSFNLVIPFVFVLVGWGLTLLKTHYLQRALDLAR